MLHDRHPKILYGLLALGATVLLAPVLLFPLSPDNDTYQAMAFAMDEGRGLPCLGSWDQNFPGIVFYHWISIKLLGSSDVAFRSIDLANRVIVSLMLFALAKRFVKPNVALLAVPISCLIYLSAGYWNMGQRDGFAVTWLILALLQVTSTKVGTRQLLIFGTSIALAFFIRPTNAAFGLLILAPIIQHRITWSQALLSAASFIGVVMVLLMPWAVTTGGLYEFYLATIRFNLDVYGPGRAPISDLVASLTRLIGYFIVSSSGLLIFIKRRHPHKFAVFIHAVLAITLILLMGKYFLYHFEILLPVTIVLFVVAIDTLSSRFRYASAATLVLALIVFYPRGLLSEYLRRGANEQAVREIQRNISSLPGYSLQDEHGVVQYLADDGLQGKTEFFLLYPGLRWRSGDPGHTRFTTTYSMTMKGRAGLTSYQQQWRTETDSILTSSRPACIVAAQGPEYLFQLSNISPDSLLHLFPKTEAMLVADYHVDTAIGGFKIYRRND